MSRTRTPKRTLGALPDFLHARPLGQMLSMSLALLVVGSPVAVHSGGRSARCSALRFSVEFLTV
jgi:hypothetical protein